jgi:DNA-binding MarR family transcriptional regulator
MPGNPHVTERKRRFVDARDSGSVTLLPCICTSPYNRRVKRSSQAPRDPSRDDCVAMWRLCLSANLRRTERIVTRHYDAYLAESGLTAAQLPIMASIAGAEEPTFRLLAEQLDLDRSTLSRNLALLRGRRLVKIDAPSGPKPGLITLTAKGKEALRDAHGRWREAQAALAGSVSSSTLDEAMRLLKILRRAMRGSR